MNVAVDHETEDQRLGAQRERGAPRGSLDVPAADDREEQQGHTDDRGLDHPAGPQRAQVEAHQQGDGDRHGDREGAPGRAGEGVDDDQGEHRQKNDHDAEHRDECRHPADHADLLAGHLAQALAVAAHREEERDHVLHGPGEDGADDDPDRPR
jgi:hypothetical protein